MELVYAPASHPSHEYTFQIKIEGYGLGCASNSIRDSVDIMLSKSGLLKYMDVVFSAQDVKKPKPEPEMYIKAIKSLGVEPKECLIVEDNENGIKAARASGSHLLVVTEVDEVNINNIYNAINKAETDREIYEYSNIIGWLK